MKNKYRLPTRHLASFNISKIIPKTYLIDKVLTRIKTLSIVSINLKLSFKTVNKRRR